MIGRWLVVAALSSLAQLPAAEDRWDNLGALRPGERIAVVDARLKSVEGQFQAYSPEAISVRAQAGLVSLPREQVLSVKRRAAAHRKRNVLLGLAAGFGGGLAAAAIRGATYHEEGETSVFMMVYGPIGAGIGAAAGAVIPAGQVTVYRRARD